MKIAGSLRGRRGLMLALDVSPLREAVELASGVAKHIDAVKIGFHLLTGPDGAGVVIREISALGLPILVDWKVFDVAHVLLAGIENLAEAGAKSVTMLASVDEEALKLSIKHFPRLELFLITGRTSSSLRVAQEEVARALPIAERCGYANVQVPGNFAPVVAEARRSLGSSACLVACGMGKQGGMAGDAIRAGADYEIVGREVYLAADPIEVCRTWRAEIETAIEEAGDDRSRRTS